MKLLDAKIGQTLRGTSGNLYRVVCVDSQGKQGRGYSVTIEDIHHNVTATYRSDLHFADYTPLAEMSAGEKSK